MGEGDSEMVDKLKDAEFRKIESEIERNQAEKFKLLKESEEIEKRIKKKWYSADRLINIVIGSIVTATVILTYTFAYYKPFLETKHELEMDIEGSRYELLKTHTNTKIRNLETMIDSLRKENQQLHSNRKSTDN